MIHSLIWHVREHTIPSALSLLPDRLDSPEARAMLLAIGLQESGFLHRRQVGGPARGFWQFEWTGGVAGVLTHPTTAPIILPLCELLRVAPTSSGCYAAIEYQDVLAAVFARLLLYLDPSPMPARDQETLGWNIYRRSWRPGKPLPATWAAHFAEAWRVIELPESPA